MKIFRKTDTPLSEGEITAWLQDMRGNPFVPASGFDVTTVFRVKAGNEGTYYFAGVNVENPDHRLSTHGEEGSISALTTALGKHAEIVEGWVMGAPRDLKPGDSHPLADNKTSCCGKCRQQIAGLADPSVVIHSVSLNGDQQSTTVGEFLPDAFNFRQFAPELAHKGTGREILPSSTAHEVEKRLIRTGKKLSQKEIFSWLKELESVDFASKTSQAVVVRLNNGAYVAGVKVEEAAFVSIDPLQSAMAIANAEFGKPKVLEVWSFGKGLDEAQLDANAFMPLEGSQVLAQFASGDTPIHLLNAKGEDLTYKLKDSAKYLRTFDRPVIEGKGPGRFIG